MTQENVGTQIEHKVGKLWFKVDGPIGRLQFLKTYGFLFLYEMIILIPLVLLLFIWGLNIYTQPIVFILLLLYFIPAIYVSVINYIKRAYDLLGNKEKSIFYVLAFLIANTVLVFIPKAQIISGILSIVVFSLLLFKKGKLVKLVNKPEND